MGMAEFMNELEEFICVIDVKTDKIVFMNKRGENLFFHREWKNKKCYSFFCNRKEPCEKCPRKRLSKEDYYVCELEKTAFGERGISKEKLIHWNGRLCHLRIQIPVREESVLENNQVLSKISHEIRTPMNAIMGMTSIAKGVVEDRKRTMECLEKIDVSTKYLLCIINDILDMSKMEIGQMDICNEEFSISDLKKELQELFYLSSKDKDITLEFCTNGANSTLYGDKGRVIRILVNLIGNAVKFTNTGGQVIVNFEEEIQGRESRIHFSVKDNGPGISTEDIHRIFKEFQNKEEKVSMISGGTGLGLAISSNLVHFMGGDIHVNSHIGEGTEFFFSLPFQRLGQNQNVIEESEEYNFQGKKLLLVEDNDLNVEIAQTLLEMVGFEVDVAENGKIAVEKFEETKPGNYDAILMDIRMPVMDGWEATRRIRTSKKADSKTISIVALSANAYEEDSKRSIENGMNGHLAKPIEVEHLYRVLNQLV